MMMNVKTNFFNIDDKNFGLRIHTNVGILSNQVGSGKTSIILALIQDNPILKKSYDPKQSLYKLIYDNSKLPKDAITEILKFTHSNYDIQFVTTLKEKQLSYNTTYLHNEDFFDSKHYPNYPQYIYKTDFKQHITTFIKLNLIIIPFNLYHQWANSIKRLLNLNVKYINTIRDFDFQTIEDLSIYDVILINSNKLKTLDKKFNLRKYHFSRVIIDEADTINIPNFPYLYSNFLWFITTTYERLLSINNNGFLKNTFTPYHHQLNYYHQNHISHYNKILLNSLVFSCEQKYIDEYMKLDNPTFQYEICKTPYKNFILYMLFDKEIEIINAINLNNYDKLYSHFRYIVFNRHDRDFNVTDSIYTQLCCNTINNSQFCLSRYQEDHINESLLTSCSIMYYLEKILKTCEMLKYYDIIIVKQQSIISNYSHLNQGYFRQKIMKNVKMSHEILDKLKVIFKIYKNYQLCMCCGKNFNNDKLNTYLIENHNYTNFNVFDYVCYKCENETLLHKNVKQKLASFKTLKWYESYIRSMLSKITMRVNRKIINIEVPELSYNDNNKMEKMEELVKQDIDNKKRILIFSNDNDYMKKVELYLKNHNVKFRMLKGNNNTINKIIKDYTKRKLQVLLLNMKFFGSGLDLQMTDIIYILNNLNTHTETQVIGRANRIGRENDLDVKYIMYEKEYQMYNSR
jgi:hypothetical protein